MGSSWFSDKSEGQLSTMAVAHMINALINRGVNLLVRDLHSLLCALVQEGFKPLGKRCAVRQRWNLLRRNRQ